MNDSNYDEFGNYLGPVLSSSESEDEFSDYDKSSQAQSEAEQSDVDMNADESPSDSQDIIQYQGKSQNQVVLHEDKKYYPDAQDVYGPDVEIIVNDEDAQPLTEPIIAPIEEKQFTLLKEDLPETFYSKEFLVDSLSYPSMSRQVAIVGHLHHGKTGFIDMLVASTHPWKEWHDAPPKATNSVNNSREPVSKNGFTMVQTFERKRGISTKAMPISLVMQNSKGKSLLINLFDTPGHVNFIDEVSAALRLCDGVVLVVDAIEGVMSNTEQVIKMAIRENLKIALVVNKIDRIVLELKLPPKDAYYKLKHTIEEVNSVISKVPGSVPEMRLSPELGNVCFSSSEYGWCFSLESFASKYLQQWNSTLKPTDFAKRLWGDIYYNPDTRKFVPKSKNEGLERSFVHFILEPVYKIHTQVIGEDEPELRPTLESLGIFLSKKEYKLNIPFLLRRVMSEFIGFPSGFVDMCEKHIPSPLENSSSKVNSLYLGLEDKDTTNEIAACSPNGPLMIHITKLYPSVDASELFAFGRVFSGTVQRGQTVLVLGEGYTDGDEEEITEAVVEDLWVFESRYRIPVAQMQAGNWVLIRGIDGSISKTATVTCKADLDKFSVSIFKPFQFPSNAVMKIAIEPVNPSELPKMLTGLRKISKTYPMSITKVEESGEHVIFGTGETYLDCVLHDLRILYSGIDIKVSDPIVAFRETVSETSAIKCFVDSPNKRNRLTMICEPLESMITTDLEAGNVSLKWPVKKLGHHFEENYGWDILAARSIWAFGPDEEFGTNILVDDTLPTETSKAHLRSVKESIKQGFYWASREGPLCEEPIRSTNFKLLAADLATEPILRGGGQIIPTARKVCYASFISAAPRLLEPVYSVEIQAPADCVSSVYAVLAKRRGHVTHDIPKPGSPLYTVKALLPIIDSFGFETDLRIHTNGQAFCQQSFDHWQVVPGDPLDKGIVLNSLQPSTGTQLAREFMVKTRRRKGLSDDISIDKYLDDPVLIELAQSVL
ncbi:hypothetical protein BB560_002997 [Smittium megazygosporum]|uniref:Tr-type G domain-containing protein n=1 Tax=Smittium megazygosporum TaxID=133381 RepID=A0A2T9ZD94_9FUNG|nr:hypothetical protein BB560_002997 [Smittium megazygosporum]